MLTGCWIYPLNNFTKRIDRSVNGQDEDGQEFHEWRFGRRVHQAIIGKLISFPFISVFVDFIAIDLGLHIGAEIY